MQILIQHYLYHKHNGRAWQALQHSQRQPFSHSCSRPFSQPCSHHIHRKIMRWPSRWPCKIWCSRCMCSTLIITPMLEMGKCLSVHRNVSKDVSNNWLNVSFYLQCPAKLSVDALFPTNTTRNISAKRVAAHSSVPKCPRSRSRPSSQCTSRPASAATASPIGGWKWEPWLAGDILHV